jgi:hypothetical protein
MNDTYDSRFKLASEEFPEEKNLNKRVKLYEEKLGLAPFSAEEIINQRRKEIKPSPGKQHRKCEQCKKWMAPQKVCRSCLEGRQGYKTRWFCMNDSCGAVIYSKKTVEEWILTS